MKLTIEGIEGLVTLETEGNNPDKPVTAVVSGHPEVKEELEYALKRSYGYYGHIMSDYPRTTNLDLYSAVTRLVDFVLLEVDDMPSAKLLEDFSPRDNPTLNPDELDFILNG